MDIEASFKSIKTLYQTISGKTDNDVILTYKGFGYGVTKPWLAKIDCRESSHENYEGAIKNLLNTLKQELTNKVKITESEVNRLRMALSNLEN